MVGQFEGADPDELDRTAGRLAQLSSQVDTCVGQVNGVVGGVQWLGHTGDHFRHSWNGSLSPRLRECAHALRDMSDTLRRNAAEQRQASGLGGSSGGMRSFAGVPGTGGSGGGLNGFLDGIGMSAGDVKKLLDGASDVFAVPDLFGTLATLGLTGGAGFASFVSQANHAMDLPGLKQLGSGVSGLASMVDAAVEGFTIGTDLAQGDYVGALGHTLSVSGTILKAGGPETYLPGVAASIWGSVVEDAQQIDWHQPLSWSDIVQYGPSSVVESVPKLVDQVFHALIP